MLLKLISRLVLPLTFCFTGSAQAQATPEDFLGNTTQNLVNLCSASPNDANYREAIHFCQGYVVGAYHYYAAVSNKNQNLQLVCFPEPKPSRNEAIDLFLSWIRNHPEYLSEAAVETEFRFLSEKWPCK